MQRVLKVAAVAAALLMVFSIDSFARPRGGPGGGGGVHMGARVGGGGGHFGGARSFQGGGARHFGGAPRSFGGPRNFGGARQFHGAPRNFAGPRHFGGRRHFSAPRQFNAPRQFGGRHFRGGTRHFAGPRGHTVRSMGNRGNRAASPANRMPRNATRGVSPQRAGMGIANVNRGNVNRAARLNLPRANAVRQGLRSREVRGALGNRNALRNPAARTALVASAATAGWHNGRRHHHHRGWWRHGRGGYGWVGPLFWPFAYYDLYDYGFWGYDDGYAFWDYGYGDIYAGLFSPYGYDTLTGYLPSQRRATTTAARSGSGSSSAPAKDQARVDEGDELARMCGADSGDIAGLPIDKIQQTISPDDAQRAALDELANASVKAAETIRAACPTSLALTAPGRLASMEQRIEAMKAGLDIIQPAMEKFYSLLNDEQKAKLTALAPRNPQPAKTESANADQSCGITSLSDAVAWPTDEINKRLRPNEEQRAKLTALQDATFKAAESLKATCQPSAALTPPARLAAAGQRLDVLLGAVKSVHAALNDFYGTLSDEQKAQFEAIGPARSAELNEAEAEPEEKPAARKSRRHSRRTHHGLPGGMENVLRHIITVVR